MLSRDQIQEWEYEFGPDPVTTVCQHCGQVHIAEASITKAVFEFDEEVTYYFCSTLCSHDFYIHRLREGM